MTRLEKALDSIWTGQYIATADIGDYDIDMICKLLKKKNIAIYYSDNEIKCIWKSYVNGRFPDKK
ncbi:MAG: hypothetical protein HQK99_03160 [Nitrospirae bacterium]|nr:hypothetical protein [Nitrospirota bacterium]MBF0456875.1 hypothetical protein [Nitrospirota bacterium]